MATKTTSHKFDAAAPLYAWVGAADLALSAVRKAAADFDARTLGTQARQRVTGRLEGLVGEAQTGFEELVTRGRSAVAKLRDESVSGDVEILRDDAEPVRDVAVEVEKAAAEAAEKVEQTADLGVVDPAPAAARKSPALRKGRAADKASGTRKPVATRRAPAKKAPAIKAPAQAAPAVKAAVETPAAVHVPGEPSA
jgi:hypothetical protein